MNKEKYSHLLPYDALEQAAECLKTIAHPVRLRMIQLLLTGEHTVGELAELCEVRDHIASEHLSRMGDRGLLSKTREGRKVYYRVAEPHLAQVMYCVQGRFGEKSETV